MRNSNPTQGLNGTKGLIKEEFNGGKQGGWGWIKGKDMQNNGRWKRWIKGKDMQNNGRWKS
jgi:hypothetical protein